MYLIPNINKKYLQANSSDVTGNIWYTKNVNFDEAGYIKLSSRSVSIYSSDEGTNFRYPLSIGRYNLTGGSHIVTSGNTDHAYELSMASTGITMSGDNTTGGNRPTGSVYNRGTWWLNKWHVTTTNSMATLNSAGTWATTGISLTSSYPHPLEVFRNRNTLVIGNKNVVSQFDTSYATGGADTTNLTLPTDYNVIGLAYQNNRMGIATQIDSSLAGQNQEAVFFIWDGQLTTASAGYPVGSDAILSVKPYKSSWVLLTRGGKLLYFNGGGFDTLITLPFFFKKYTVNADSTLGDIMTVDGDLIYLNLTANINYYGFKQEVYMQNFVGGVLCYDPTVGLYNRYTPSRSKFYTISTTVDTTTNIFTTSGTLPTTGNPIMYTSEQSNPAGGITIGKIYYIIRHSSTTFSLATTRQNAIDGNKIDITSAGGTNVFMGLEIVDYGIARGTVTNAVTTLGNQNYFYDNLMFGGYYEDTASLTPKYTLCLTVPMFKSIGYYVTTKLESENINDNFQQIFVKYKPLKEDDSIIVKYKDADVIGLPVSTLQLGTGGTWTSNQVFTTTTDISEAYTYMQTSGNQLECEILTGAGAGQMSQITSIAYNGTTYTVTLDDEIEGVTTSNVCTFIIDNWKYADTITYTDTQGWKGIPVVTSSKYIYVKVIMQGNNIQTEGLQIVNKSQIPAK